jgi:transcriptional regulator with XRE-family HTH domain
MDELIKIGQRIREARGERAQSWLALEISKLTGTLLTKQVVANWEAGRNMPSLKHLICICKVLNTSADFILGIDVCRKTTCHKAA